MRASSVLSKVPSVDQCDEHTVAGVTTYILAATQAWNVSSDSDSATWKLCSNAKARKEINHKAELAQAYQT